MIAIEPIPGATRVTVLRHGQVAGQAHVFRGDLDDPLSGEGWAAMEGVLQRLATADVDEVATSPRLRCQAFARAWAEARGLPLTVMEGFREMSFGAWEGLSAEEATKRDPAAFRLFRASAGESGPPRGESVPRLRARVRVAWADWLADARGGHRLLVTHGGVMRALLMELLGLPAGHAYRIALPEAAHFQVSVLPGEPAVLLNLNPCAA